MEYFKDNNCAYVVQVINNYVYTLYNIVKWF